MTMLSSTGDQLDATIEVVKSGQVIFHARGGAGDDAWNLQYSAGLLVVLENLHKLNATITDVSIHSRDALKKYTDDQRRVPIQAHRFKGPVWNDGKPYKRDDEVDGYPIVMREVPDLEKLRLSICRGQKYAAGPWVLDPYVKPGRNTTRRIAITFECRIKDPVKLFERLGGLSKTDNTDKEG